MPDGYRIFRPAAIERYAGGRDKAVLPRLVSPRTFLALWALLGLLATAGVAAWSARTPVYASGPAVVLEPRDNGVAVAVVLPAVYHPLLRAGQPVFLDVSGGSRRVRRSIVMVEPQIISPDAARRRF